MDRLGNHRRLAAALEAMSDQGLLAAMAQGVAVAQGIGGPVRRLDVDGVAVVAKGIPLGEREAEPSTRNHYALPPICHYGLSSPGAGAWRELAAQEQASQWVRSGACAAFPLLHHWRVLPRVGPPVDELELARQETAWGPGFGLRLRERAGATRQLVLFLEHLPQALRPWLHEDPSRLSLIEAPLLETAAFLRERGFAHFDAHLENLMTDGSQVYVCDFGLALSADFELDAAERSFLHAHGDYDRSLLVTALSGALRQAPEAADFVARYASVDQLMRRFFAELRHDRATPYPAAALAAAWRDAS